MATPISDELGLISWASSGTSGILTDNINMTMNTALNLEDGSILDGDGYTIINNSSKGLFWVSGTDCEVHISNLEIDCNGITFNTSDGVLIRRISSTGTTLVIRNCYASGTFIVGQSSGIVGPVFKENYNITISNCYSTGTLSNNNSGGILGAIAKIDETGYVLVENCYSTGAISGSGSGGIVGSQFGNFIGLSGTAIVRNCYSTGDIGENCGGIVGSNFGYNAGYATIENCYSVGSLGNGGTIAGPYLNGTNVTLINCYGANTIEDDNGYKIGLSKLVKSKLSVPPEPIFTNCTYGNGSVPGWDHSTATSTIADIYGYKNKYMDKRR
jgi:hypothetical protein